MVGRRWFRRHRQLRILLLGIGDRFVLVAVQGQEVLVEQQFHTLHGLLDIFGFQLAFPNDDDLPAIFSQQLIVLLISFSVSPNFVDPKLFIGLWNPTTWPLPQPLSSGEGGVTMPETAVDKDGGTVFPHHDVGLPWNTFHVEAVAIAMPPQPLPHLELRLGVATADARHHVVTLFRSEDVHHDYKSSSENAATCPQTDVIIAKHVIINRINLFFIMINC